MHPCGANQEKDGLVKVSLDLYKDTSGDIMIKNMVLCMFIIETGKLSL